MPHTPFDPQIYLHHLDGLDLSEAEKIEFIRTLWLIAQCFVDDAFALDNPKFKSGVEAANVVDLPSAKQTAANDNKKEPDARRKNA